MAKIRNGFVSNSSSSSFIIIGELTEKIKNLLYEKDSYTKILNPIIKESIIKTINENTRNNYHFTERKLDIINLENKNKDIFLTTYISDGGDNYYKLRDNFENVYEYEEGNHGFPYDEESHVNIKNNIWIKKENLENEKEIGICK